MLLIHAFASLLKKTEKPFQLFIGGEFRDRRYKEYMPHIIRQLGLEQRVHFDGFIADVPGWLRDKHFIVCSSPFEGQIVSVMEGMACGLRPLVHDFPGASEVYDPDFVWTSIDDFAAAVMDEGGYDPARYRQFIGERYDLADQMRKIEEMLEGYEEGG
jgi:glycosyltransferase involved in cell wall biosynthesis